MEGIISTTQKGAGYIDDPKNPKKDSVFIDVGFLNTALNGDRVKVALGPDNTGRVVKVLSRARTTFVGVTRMGDGRLVLIPDDRKMYVNMVLDEKGDKDGKDLKEGLKVQAQLIEWTDPKELPRGKVLRVLGEKGNNDVEMESIVLESGFELNFPPYVEREADEIHKKQSTITADEVARRRDMRSTLTFTIDPFDAKDFDDAISFVAMNEYAGKAGTFYEVGVHIADVAHYVREGSALDREALRRGCSVYLVDRTIPMLPEVLSNDLCSLKPHEDKLAFSAVFVLDEKARVLSRWFGRTVINSAHRFTYETAQESIDGKSDTYRVELQTLNALAKHLMREKFSKGAIEFESEEVKFKLDDKGKPIGVYVKQRLDTHKLVEEFMLLANREVAKFISDKVRERGASGARGAGSIYRIHDAPDKDRIKSLAFFVKALGYELKTKDGAVTAHALNDLLDQIENTPHESLVRTAAIRSMQKAVYSTKNIGHFGLAAKYYTHFTSPIRRYPDVLVHRILARHLHDEPIKSGEVASLQSMAESSTEREIDAAGAERASVKLKQVEYMSQFIGKTFEGTVSGVTKWGLYVEENETKSEGMIHISRLGNDYFNFDEKNFAIVGEKSSKKYTLGDPIRFKVEGADLDKKTLDYALI